jgi:hypothetical protein
VKKIFILGLPRTGTTSLCHLFLQHNVKVAHTAFTQAAFNNADVIADTPVFSDYKELNQIFPESQWIYLHRNFDQWLPSIRIMIDKLRTQPKERFHPLILRSFQRVFGSLDNPDVTDEQHLEYCYTQHEQKIRTLQNTLNKNLIRIELTRNNDGHHDHNITFKDLITELNNSREQSISLTLKTTALNLQGEITAWQKLKHPNKVPSHLAQNGRRHYFKYSIES